MGECLRIANLSRNAQRLAQPHHRDAQCAQHGFGHCAALGLPGVALAERAAIADQHQQGHAVQLRARHDAIDRRQKAVVLHQHRRPDASQVRAHRDTDAFFLLCEPHQRDVGVVVCEPDQVDEPGLRQRGYQSHAVGLQRVEDELGVGCRDRHGPRCYRKMGPLWAAGQPPTCWRAPFFAARPGRAIASRVESANATDWRFSARVPQRR